MSRRPPGRELGAWCAAVVLCALLLLVARPAGWQRPASALAFASAAAVGGVLGTRGNARRAVGLALVAVGVVTVAGVPVVGVTLAALGAAAVVRAGRWPALGRRFGGPTAASRDEDDWAVLDRGEDPTDR